MQYYERIKSIRTDSDHTQKEMAAILGCSEKQVIRYEKGEQEMTISKLRRLCNYYKVSSDYILGLPKDLEWPR